MAQQNVNPAEAYHEYLGPAIFVPWTGVLLEHARPRAGERALDLACGTGIVTRRVAEAVGSGGRVVGVDISPDMLAVARSRPAPDGAAAIEWREGNASALHLPAGSFDLVLCQQGFQFFPDRPAAVRGVRRVLRNDGGRFALAVWKGLDHHRVFAALFEAEAKHLNIPVSKLATPFSLGDAGEIRRLLEQGGFRRVEITEKTQDVHFPEPDRFITMTVLAGAAVIPELAEKDPAAREALVQAVTREAQPIIQQHRRGERLTFPMTANVAVAHTE